MGSVPAGVLLDATVRTLVIAAWVAVLSGALGVVLAWLVSRAEFPGGRTAAGLLTVPYAIPAYLLGMAWVVLGNPAVGLLRGVLPPGGSYGTPGIVFVETCVAFAFPFLELRAGFERLDPSLEEAARLSGARPWRVFRDVSLPLLWPSLVHGMCLAFLYALASFGVPAILGLPVRQQVLTTLIYSELRLGGAAGLRNGLALSALLLALAGAVLVLSRALVRLQRARDVAITSPRSSPASRVRLGRGALPAAAFTWGFFGLVVVLPWCALGLSALAPVAGRYAPTGWTAANLVRVLGLPDVREALVNSVVLAGVVASLVTGGGFLLAFAAVRRRRRWAARLVEVLGVPFATPGTVLALVLIVAAALLSRLGVPADAPLLLMAVAYGLKYAAVAAGALVAGFRQVHPALEEAARVSGARTARLLWTIWRPLLAGHLRAAWWLAALPMLTELTMSVLLTGPGAATLGTVLFRLQEYADQTSAAALAWLLLTVVLVVRLSRPEARVAEGR